jgi:uncharacterized protein YnzC (UPF0291/DUF896 family)
MNEEQIKRINELARIKKDIGLTPEEEKEQKVLYRQYIDWIKGGVRAALDEAAARPAGSCSCGDPDCKHSH